MGGFDLTTEAFVTTLELKFFLSWSFWTSKIISEDQQD